MNKTFNKSSKIKKDLPREGARDKRPEGYGGAPAFKTTTI